MYEATMSDCNLAAGRLDHEDLGLDARLGTARLNKKRLKVGVY